MGQAIPTQHPAVVLRSHYRQLRALLAIAMIAVVGLTAAVVILAEDEATSASSATQVSAPSEPADGPRYIHPPANATTPAPTAPSPPSRGSRSRSPHASWTDQRTRPPRRRGGQPFPSRRLPKPSAESAAPS